MDDNPKTLTIEVSLPKNTYEMSSVVPPNSQSKRSYHSRHFSTIVCVPLIIIR